jgi:DNA-directed RNA polymerase subunit RPC12/RpoP
MGETFYIKTSCLKCGGPVEFPEEAENSTVPCPHCGKDLFLHRGVRAVETLPVMQGGAIRPMEPSNYTQSTQQTGQALKLLSKIGGFILFIIGVVLLVGNTTGLFVTFPFAGFVTMTIGGALFGIGNAKQENRPLPPKQRGFNPNSPATSEILEATIVDAANNPNSPVRASHYRSNSGMPMGAIISVVIVILLIMVGAIVYFVRSGGGLTTEKLEAEVRQSIQDKFLKDTKGGTQVKSFSLVHESGNKYKGFLEIQTGQQTATKDVDVTYDGRTFMWETVPSSISPQSKQPVNTSATPTQIEPEPTPTPTIRETPRYDWNTSEIDALQNGNIAVAVNWIKRSPNLRQQATAPQPELVAKTPYIYYGQVVKFTGTVGVVQDFPPGSDFSQSLGGQNTSDIVMIRNDGTIIEMFCLKASGYIRVGNTVNLFGYPVGVTDVPNRMGGNDVHLIVVGNDYDNLRAAQ